jgi:hypothetical protein
MRLKKVGIKKTKKSQKGGWLPEPLSKTLKFLEGLIEMIGNLFVSIGNKLAFTKISFAYFKKSIYEISTKIGNFLTNNNNNIGNIDNNNNNNNNNNKGFMDIFNEFKENIVKTLNDRNSALTTNNDDDNDVGNVQNGVSFDEDTDQLDQINNISIWIINIKCILWLSYYTFKLVFDVLFSGFGVLFDTLKKYSPTVEGIFKQSFGKIKNLFGNLFEKNDEQDNGQNDINHEPYIRVNGQNNKNYEPYLPVNWQNNNNTNQKNSNDDNDMFGVMDNYTMDPIVEEIIYYDPNTKRSSGGSANVLKVSKEQFAKLVNKISKSSVSGFKKLFELSKLIKLDANGQKAKKLFEVLASKRNMAIITGSLFAISYAISYLLKKSTKKIEKKFDKETELTKEDMEKIKDNLDKKLQKIKEAENLKNQIKTLVKI